MGNTTFFTHHGNNRNDETHSDWLRIGNHGNDKKKHSDWLRWEPWE